MVVASHTGATLAYDLPLLNKDDSWKLFSRKVFQEEECPSDLVDLGKSMVEDCGGLPLAIIVLAGAAATKKSQKEWSRIKDQVNRRLAHDKQTKVMDILKLSYDKLPQELKPCFLYFAMYPEDHEIDVGELIQLWIAEGFIQVTEHSNPSKLEDVAEDYLDELVHLSLVQVARRSGDGSVQTCRIHDLLRELCISESRHEKFLDVCTSASSNPRRLSCQCVKESCIMTSNNKRCQSCIRSLICFGERNDDHQKHTMKSFVERFKLARVLDFGTVTYMVPNGLKTLTHLRYLRIRFSLFYEDHDKEVPACIFCLCNLEVLKIEGFYRTTTICSGMWKLKRLRHLFVDRGIDLIADMSKPESEIMSNLQTLTIVELDPQTPSILNNDRFPNLIALTLRVDPRSRDDEPFRRLSHLRNLRTLQMATTLNVPSNDAFLSNLTNIAFLYGLAFDLHAMETFGKLAKLQVLSLICIESGFDTGYDINCAAGDFPNLKMFDIYLHKLSNWRLGEGAMPCLEHVVIRECRILEGLPQELWSLTKLQNVEIIEPSARFDKILKDGMVMKNGCKIIITK